MRKLRKLRTLRTLKKKLNIVRKRKLKLSQGLQSAARVAEFETRGSLSQEPGVFAPTSGRGGWPEPSIASFLAAKISRRMVYQRYASNHAGAELPWRKTGPPDHQDDTVDSDQ